MLIDAHPAKDCATATYRLLEIALDTLEIT